MILKALTLENFKGIREPVRIEFAPLTLLFGPNNAGKSTIVQALMYAREVLERNNCDAGRTELGANVVDLGGFKNLVHAHDHQNLAIRMRFDLDLRSVGLPDYTESVRENELSSTVHVNKAPTRRYRLRSPEKLAEQDLWVELEVAWSDVAASPIVKTYRTGCRDAVYAIVDYSAEGSSAVISYLNVSAPPFGSKVIHDIREISATNSAKQSENSEGAPAPKAIRRDVIWKVSGWFSELLDSLLKSASTLRRPSTNAR